MSDYIDRDLLLAEIKELKKSPWYNGCGENYERIIRSDAIGVVVDLCIKSAPAVDVSKIVRCKDCKNYELMKSNNSHFCNEFGGYVTERDFCSRAQKMDGGKNNA